MPRMSVYQDHLVGNPPQRAPLSELRGRDLRQKKCDLNADLG